MIVRLWKTRVDENRITEYEQNERNRSTPMFHRQPGCLGVLFLRAGENCLALPFGKILNLWNGSRLQNHISKPVRLFQFRYVAW